MGRHVIILLFIGFLALRGSHACVSPEDYWKNKLPTTPMPQSIKDSLVPYGEVTPKSGYTSTRGYDALLSYAKDYAKSSVDGLASGTDDLSSYTKTSRKLLAYMNWYDEVLSYVEESQSNSINIIMKDQAFFVEADLHRGKKMNVVFKKGNKKNLFFLPREVSNKIPFSSGKLSKIYDIFSVDPKSREAYVVSKGIELCEEPMGENMEKKCATSLESMVDFVISEIGNNVKALTTNLEKDYPKMEYTILKAKKMTKNDNKVVVCHKMEYPYAVFFCHRSTTIKSYAVSLVGNDGTRIEAIAACHKETNEVLRKYMVDVLKVVPGSTRICHFPSANDSIIWVAE